MKIAEVQRATALIEQKTALELLMKETLAKEPTFADHGKISPIGRLQLSKEQLSELQRGLKEATQGFFGTEIGKISDALETMGIDTGRE